MAVESTSINLGPQHPSTHGVLRIILELDGEFVVDAKPDIGYLHRGIEKLAEHRTYHQIIILTDRLDYLSAMSNNLAYVLTVEKLLNIEVPKRAQYIRVALTELQRIASHLFWLGTHAHDLGAMTPLFYTLREREIIMDIFDSVAGSRLTPGFMRIGGLAADLERDVIERIREFTDHFPHRVDEYELLLTGNPIWKSRTKNVGILSADECINLGMSGPLLRSAGYRWDLRKSNPYSSYEDFEFDIPTGTAGDVYDRYLMRIREMRESAKIVRQTLDGLPNGPFIVDDPSVTLPGKARVGSDIYAMIQHFNLVVHGIRPPVGEVYHSIESPRGELGFYIVSDGSDKPYRMKVRSPSFVNLQSLVTMIKGKILPDAIAVISTIDIVLGEVDR
jgi:NADH-quinone oxidoreductase subunit D